MNSNLKYGLILGAMFLSVLASIVLKPTIKIADQGIKVDLETMIPRHFGEWHEDPQQKQIINPQVIEQLNRIYNQTLSRNYTNAYGERIMLSIAYGKDQSDAHQLHYPEVCYPSQGFKIFNEQQGIIKTKFGDIRVKRLLTAMGNRSEPLTYWTTIGYKVVLKGHETKIEQLRYGLKGEIPDGLIFRISSITNDVEKGFLMQQVFASQLIENIPPESRYKLAGLSSVK